MKRSLLLVHPPQRGLLNGFANGLIDMANFVVQRQPDASVAILDLALTSEADLAAELRRALRELTGPTVVGITTTTASYRSAIRVARAAKAVSSDVLIVLGGHHASPQHNVVLRHHPDVVDLVIRGEGERALLDLIRGHALESISGSSMLRSGIVVEQPTPPLLTQHELDELPVAFRDFSLQSAPGKFEHVTYVSARGCPLHCAFCAVAGQAIRAKSVGRVCADLEYLARDRGYRKIAIEDNFFAQNRDRTMALLSAIALLQQEGAPFRWDCQTRVESMQATDIQDAFARAGCEAVYLGVESLSESELAYLQKTPHPARYIETTERVCSTLLAQPYECFINIQVALPGESEASRNQRFARLTELGRPAARRRREITVFPQINVMYPGTLHFQRAVADGTFGALGNDVFEEFCEWEANEEPILTFLGDNFAHGVGGIPLGLLDGDALRRGAFLICADRVEMLREHLRALRAVDGIKIFEYGAYLAGSATRAKSFTGGAA